MPRVAANKRDAHEKARRDQIVEAAIRLWLQRGFDATTVAQIAREAGLAKGTLYLYFRTKEEILDEAIRRYSLFPNLEQALQAMGDAPVTEAVPALVRAMWHMLKERTAVVQLFVRKLAVRPEHARQFIEHVVLPTNRLLAQHLDREVESGTLRPVDTFVAVRGLAGMIVLTLVTQEIFGAKEIHPLTDEQITETISEVFLHGILARREEPRDAA